LILNPLDVTAPYWGASWLAGERWCGKQASAPTTHVRLHCQVRNMKRLLRFVLRKRAARQRAAEQQQWTLARIAVRWQEL